MRGLGRGWSPQHLRALWILPGRQAVGVEAAGPLNFAVLSRSPLPACHETSEACCNMHITNGSAFAHIEDAARHGLFAVQVHEVTVCCQ